MFNVINVSKAYGPKKLFEEVNATFSPGRRYGLTGPNGAGKSTFMKILAGDEEADTGNIVRPRKFGILRQDHFRYEEDRVLDVVLMGNKALWDAMQEKNKLLAKSDITEEDGNRLGELEGVIAEEDGYVAESDAASLLLGLGIEESFHEGPLKQLTGGLKLRVLLAQALFGKPEGLLLDEPTNNLDIESIRWLETFLHNYEGVLITISHDRHFLNSICTHIADIDYEAIIQYTGGYDDMVVQKSQLRNRVDQKVASGKQTLMIDSIQKSYDGVQVIKPFKSLVVKGEKIAVIGRNGAGKSTLVKMIAGQVEPDAGSLTWGHQASVDYLPQDHHGVIRKGTTAFGWLRDINEKLSNEEISGVLGRMLFSGDERMKATDTLSGGETVRVLLSKLMIMQDNVLVLDEPTNHLDLESISALADGLKKFEGTVIVVTHDQELISEVATRIWSLKAGQEVIDFNGPFNEFLQKHDTDIAVRGGGRR
jgi:ATPase subunit of ABC transporter with duplicated ATPase domains